MDNWQRRITKPHIASSLCFPCFPHGLLFFREYSAHLEWSIRLGAVDHVQTVVLVILGLPTSWYIKYIRPPSHINVLAWPSWDVDEVLKYWLKRASQDVYTLMSPLYCRSCVRYPNVSVSSYITSFIRSWVVYPVHTTFLQVPIKANYNYARGPLRPHRNCVRTAQT